MAGKVEGITSTKIGALEKEMRQHQAVGLTAIVEFYAATSDAERDAADNKAKDAYRNAQSAETRRQGLTALQAEHQARKQDIAAWLQTVLNGTRR